MPKKRKYSFGPMSYQKKRIRAISTAKARVDIASGLASGGAIASYAIGIPAAPTGVGAAAFGALGTGLLGLAATLDGKSNMLAKKGQRQRLRAAALSHFLGRAEGRAASIKQQAGLVQRAVTYRTRSGKVASRMQWVRPDKKK